MRLAVIIGPEHKNMRRTFSGPSTFFWKFVFTTALFGSVAYGLLMCWSGRFKGSDGKPFPLEALVVFTLLGAVVVSAVIAATRKLKRVAVEDGYLCVSNYFTEVRIALSEVASVHEYSGTSAAKQYTRLVVDLEKPCAFGKRIVFLPKPRLYWSGTHPVVRQLWALCEQGDRSNDPLKKAGRIGKSGTGGA